MCVGYGGTPQEALSLYLMSSRSLLRLFLYRQINKLQLFVTSTRKRPPNKRTRPTRLVNDIKLATRTNRTRTNVSALANKIKIYRGNVSIPMARPIRGVRRNTMRNVPRAGTPNVKNAMSNTLRDPIMNLPKIMTINTNMTRRFAIPVSNRRRESRHANTIRPILVLQRKEKHCLGNNNVIRSVPIMSIRSLHHVNPNNRQRPKRVLLDPFNTRNFLLHLNRFFRNYFPTRNNVSIYTPFRVHRPLYPRHANTLNPLPTLINIRTTNQIVYPTHMRLTTYTTRRVSVNPLHLLHFPTRVAISHYFSTPSNEQPTPSPYPLQ